MTKIVQVSICERRCYIPVKGWESVESAILTFANGYSSGSRAAENKHHDDLGKSHGENGGLAVSFSLLAGAIVGGRSRLVNDLLSEAKQALKDRAQYSKHYDYDGMGTSFFKTSITIKVLDRKEDMYGIGISAAYVGDEPEQGLATYFGIPRALSSCAVEVEMEPLAGDRFEFDFEPIVRKLEGVLPLVTTKLTGANIAQALMEAERTETVVLHYKDGLEVCISPGRVQSRMTFDRGARAERDTWSVNGSVLCGELQRDYRSRDENVKATPTFLITVRSSQKDEWRGTIQLWKPDQQQQAIALANKIADALK